MRIINETIDTGYEQWICDFCSRVIRLAEIECDEVVIEDIEYSKRIFILIDGKEYIIRTWNFSTCKWDDKNQPCSEIVRYTLFEDVIDDNGNGYGVEISNGCLMIEWIN